MKYSASSPLLYSSQCLRSKFLLFSQDGRAHQERFEDDGVAVVLNHLDVHFDDQLRCDSCFGLCVAFIDLHRYRVHVFVQNCSFFHVKSVPECILLLIFSQLANVLDDLHVSGTLYYAKDRVWLAMRELKVCDGYYLFLP